MEFLRFSQNSQKPDPVLVIRENRPALVPTHGDMSPLPGQYS